MLNTVRRLPMQAKTDGIIWLYRAFVITAFIIMAGWSISPIWPYLHQSRVLSGLKLQLSKTRKEEQRLRREIKQLKKDDAYIELLARRKLGLVKPGEESYIVVEQQPPAVRRDAAAALGVKVPD